MKYIVFDIAGKWIDSFVKLGLCFAVTIAFAQQTVVVESPAILKILQKLLIKVDGERLYLLIQVGIG
jgi:hypothetical protein